MATDRRPQASLFPIYEAQMHAFYRICVEYSACGSSSKHRPVRKFARRHVPVVPWVPWVPCVPCVPCVHCGAVGGTSLGGGKRRLGKLAQFRESF
jgi:hypothetical protein